MRTSIPLALLGAALFAGFGTAQFPLGPIVDAQVTADQGLKIRHDSPAGTEFGILPPGTVIDLIPKGPKCPHWPTKGVGVDYWVVKEKDAFVYEGVEYLRAFAGDNGEIGPHDNVIRMTAPSCIPALVEIEMDSLLDAEHYHAWASVEVVGFGTVYHDFVAEQTRASVPAMVDRLGLEVRVNTHFHVDNSTAPTFQGLADFKIKISVRLPGGEYVTGGFGCPGPNAPILAPVAGEVPVIGHPFSVVVDNLPAGPAFGMLSNALLEPPLDLGLIGMAGCELYVYTPVAVPLVKSAGTAVWTIPIPLDLSLVKAEFYQQVFAIDPTAIGLGAVVSNYGEGTIGLIPVFVL